MTTDEIISSLISGEKPEVDKTISFISNKKPAEILQQLVSILLSKEDAKRKSAALRALKCFPKKETVPVCIDILQKSPSFLIKKEIIDFLATSHDRRIVIPVAKELSSPFFAVRESAILALKSVGDDRMYPFILNMMESRNPIYKVYALQAIYHLYDMRFYYLLLETLKNKNKSIRYYVLRCIEKNELKDSLKHVRRTALKDNSWEVRVKAVRILGGLNDRNSLQVLLQCLGDKNREVRFSSAKSLYILRFKKAARSLSYQLYIENDDEIKTVIIDTLIVLKNAGRYKGLKKVLESDKNIEMKVRAAYALGRIRKKGSVPILLRGLNDAHPKVRAEVCHSLGNYKMKGVAIELLNIVNDDPARYVRTAALYSIKRIGKRIVILPLLDRYVIEKDPVFKEKLRFVIRGLVKKIA